MALKLNGLGVTTLRELLKTEYTGRIRNKERVGQVLEAAITGAVKDTWALARHAIGEYDITLATVASQAYTVLPKNLLGWKVPKGGLYNSDDPSVLSRVHFAHPLEHAHLTAQDASGEGWPERFCVRYRSVDGVSTPVVEWRPPPDAIYNIGGLVVRVGAPDVEFGTVETDSDYAYLPRELDTLLEITAKKRLVCESGQIAAKDVKWAALESRNLSMGYAQARRDALEWAAHEQGNMEPERVDVNGWVQELQSAHASTAEDADWRAVAD